MTARRDFEVIGETLVKVRCGAHLSGVWYSGQNTGTGSQVLHLVNELGLATGPIKVSLMGHHDDMRIDGYGKKVAADVMFDYAEAKVDMTLIHYNPSLLELCYNESMGGMRTNYGMTPPGTPLGAGKVLYASGCHYLGLTLWPATQARFEVDYVDAGGYELAYFQSLLALLGLDPGDGPDDFARTLIGSGAWTFWASYITMQPQTIPLGTKVTAIDVSWRSIVYPHFYGNTGLSSGGSPKEIPSPAAPVASGGSLPLYSRIIPDAILDRENEVFVP